MYPISFKKKKTLLPIKRNTGPGSDIIIVCDFNILCLIARSSSKGISELTSKLNYTIDQINLIGIYRVIHPTTTEYTFCSAAHRTFSKTDQF
jgi:predicted amidohydrolase